MRSKLEMKNPVLAELSIEVPVEEVHAAVNKAFATLSRKAKIRGFRQGKAPRAVLKRMFGDSILHEVRGDIVNDTLLAAFAEHEIVPLNQPNLDAPEVLEDAAYAFKATFEVRPKLDHVNYDGVVLERAAIKVEDAEVDEELVRIRASMASVNELSAPRPAADGDAATISLRRGKDDGFEEKGLDNQQVVVGEGQAPAAIDAALVGMNVGDEKVVEVAMGPEGSDENKIRYQVRLTDLKERKLPELDDELAKDTGEYDTLDALKADIRKRIAEAKGRNEDRRLRTVMYDALREKNPMELPPSLVSRQAESLKTQLYRGVIEQMAKDESDEGKEALQKLAENADKTAVEMVHQQLLMAEIARLSSITVDDDDVDAEIEKRAQDSGLPAPMLRAEMNKAGRRDDLAVQILDTKIFEFVKTLVKIVEVDGEVKTVVSAGDAGEKAVSVATTEDKSDADASADADEKGKKKTATKKVAAKKSDAEGDEAGTETKKKTVAKKATAKKVAAEGDEGADDKKTAKKSTAKKKPAEE